LSTAPQRLSNGPYSAHRERQRRRILAAAEKLFDVHGIDRVTMADVVIVAGIRASTMYKYFANKNEVVWTLVEQVMVQSAQGVRAAIEGASGNGLAKIAALFEAFEFELVHHPARVRFMAQFDAMYARDWSVERLLAVEDKIIPGRFEPLAVLVRAGISDGSLRLDLNPDLTMHAVMNALVGAQRRLASLGTRVEEEYGQPVHLLFRETVRVILLGLRVE
jgi:AcrR family transcriptional regulator